MSLGTLMTLHLAALAAILAGVAVLFAAPSGRFFVPPRARRDGRGKAEAKDHAGRRTPARKAALRFGLAFAAVYMTASATGVVAIMSLAGR